MIYKDNRGYVGSIYRSDSKYEYAYKWKEDRFSVSKEGVIRGFHGDSKTYKLTSVLFGEIKLVVYDLIYREKEEYMLTPASEPVLIKPHTLNGHQCLSKDCVLYYKWSEYYDLNSQWSVAFNDYDIKPNWVPSYYSPIVSERDLNAPSLRKLLETLGM